MSEMFAVYGKESKITKAERYGWQIKDQPGRMEMINKNLLKIHPSYQRQSMATKILAIASSWSWIGCGVIIVGLRGDELWVIDGQHRVLASRKRVEIEKLPCLIFETDSVKQEARGFLDANVARGPVNSLDKYRAALAAEDETAIYISEVFESLGIVPTKSEVILGFKAMGWAMTKALEDKEAFDDVMGLVAQLCRECAIKERLVAGLYYLLSKFPKNDHRLHDRIKKVGARKLLDAANRASVFLGMGGGKVWAEAMLNEINKGISNKFVFDKK